MQDFLTFKTFITPALLMFFYYFGAIIIPLVSYMLAKWIRSSYFKDSTTSLKVNLNQKQRITILAIAIACFICMEIFWRILFEFLIAYFDMHDALMKLV